MGRLDEELVKLHAEVEKIGADLEAKGLIERVGMRGGEVFWGLTEAGRNFNLVHQSRGDRRRSSPSRSAEASRSRP